MHDVIVIGAGPGGSSTAHYLAQSGLDILLLDKSNFPRDKTCGDGLTPRAVSVLHDMALFDDLLRIGCRINRFEVVAPNGNRTSAPIPSSATLPNLSFVVPRFVLDEKILNRAIESGAKFESGVHASVVEHEATNIRVEAESKGSRLTYRAKMVVIATGANSKLLTASGILQQTPRTMVASRAYFESVKDISDVWQLRFDGVPLPGYGWIFPTGDGKANIGAGYFAKHRKSSAANAFDQFTRTPALRELLSNAKQISPIKGFPLRADFTTSPTFSNRVLLVGEAAGLVNPLTGEGIDYALESGRIAAKHIARVFERDDFSRASIQQYDDELRLHFQSLFEFCMFVRDRLCDKAWLLNFLVRAANQREDLRTRLARVVLGSEAITGKVTIGRAMKALLRKV
jgi:geranylgeranyl reductase family protein